MINPNILGYSALQCAVLADDTETARSCLNTLKINWCPLEQAEVIVVIGGDGFMLRAMHQFYTYPVRLYGLNTGRIGFLLNRIGSNCHALTALIHQAIPMRLVPLHITVTDMKDNQYTMLAFNEVTFFRETRQALRLSIAVDNICRLDSFMGDGLMVATPAGSTAYNLSAGGPVLPLDANILSITAMSAFRPRRWPGALISHDSHIRIDIKEYRKRPVSFSADYHEIRGVITAEIIESRKFSITLLFDPDQSLS